MLTDSEWERFFELLEKVTDIELPFEAKKQMVMEKAKETDGETALEEFCSWGMYE